MNGVLKVIFRIKTQQAILLDQAPVENELPLRQWRMELVMLDKNGLEVPANILSHVTYHLHPTFVKPKRKVIEPPFAIEEVGWGEFDLQLVCKIKENCGTIKLLHDLSFSEDAYAVDFEVPIPYGHNQPFCSLLSTHFDLDSSKRNSVKKVVEELPKWVKNIPKMDEDAVQLFLQKVLANPAVKSYVNKKQKNEEIVLCLSELPEELLLSLDSFMSQYEPRKEVLL
ncbi:Something about silencing protein 5 [Nakaseomyces bracarensis]|uniref:Something about silencing protein 5 n=1 Tax=Nakaseomyces bracarensis TaxID=273131 RepID=A0ABR4NXT6_9SACH